jgi:hypothetical protein
MVIQADLRGNCNNSRMMSNVAPYPTGFTRLLNYSVTSLRLTLASDSKSITLGHLIDGTCNGMAQRNDARKADPIDIIFLLTAAVVLL